MKSAWSLFSTAATACLVFSSCGDKRGESSRPEFPEVPPLEAFAINLPRFASNTSTAANLSYSLTDPYANFSQAAFVTLPYWGVELLLTIPKLAFDAAIKQHKTLVLSDGTLAREFDISYLGKSLNGKLTAKIIDVESRKVEWKFFVTVSPEDASGCCNNSLWFEGITSSLGTARSSKGDFFLYDLSGTEAPANDRVRRYEYTYDEENPLTYAMTLTNLVDVKAILGNDFKKGSYVSRSVEGREIKITVQKDPAVSPPNVVKWDIQTEAGSHSRPDGTLACWNENHENILCQ